MESMGIN